MRPNIAIFRMETQTAEQDLSGNYTGIVNIHTWDMDMTGSIWSLRNAPVNTTTMNTVLSLNNLGNMGLGVVPDASGPYKLTVGGYIHSTSGGYKFPDGTIQSTALNAATQWKLAANGTDIYYDNGSVGIGCVAPQHKLVVNGTISSQKNIVENITGCDFVFEPGYKMLSIPELADFIKIKKHLPEVPSAKEMESKGVELGEMNMKLLQKVEELTLYIIDLSKQNQEQNKKIETLEKKIEDRK